MRWFDSTSARVAGVAGLVIAAVLAGLGLAGALPAWWLGSAAVVAWLAWAAMLRPRIGVSPESLVLRGLVSTTTIPLGRVERHEIRQVLAVWADGRRYTSAAVSRPRTRAPRPGSAVREPGPEPGQAERPGPVRGPVHASMPYADVVDDVIRSRMRDAPPSHGTVTTTWAWAEIGLGAASLLSWAVLALR